MNGNASYCNDLNSLMFDPCSTVTLLTSIQNDYGIKCWRNVSMNILSVWSFFISHSCAMNFSIASHHTWHSCNWVWWPFHLFFFCNWFVCNSLPEILSSRSITKCNLGIFMFYQVRERVRVFGSVRPSSCTVYICFCFVLYFNEYLKPIHSGIAISGSSY